MADNPFDQFDAPANANPFDRFDPSTAKLTRAPQAPPPEPSLARSAIDYGKDVGAGVLSGTSGIMRGVGELGRRVAAPLVSAFNTGAGTDALSAPVNAFNAPADALQGASNEIVQSEAPSNQNGMGHTLVRGLSAAAPAIAGTLLTDGATAPAVGASLFGAQGGGDALANQRDRIRSLSADAIAKLPGYQAKIAAGAAPDAAREQLAQEAGQSAFLPAAGVGAAFGAIPGSAPVEGAIKTLSGAAPTLTRNLLTRAAVDAPIFGGLSAGQEAAENAGAQSATGETGPVLPNPLTSLAGGALPALAFGAVGALLHRRIPMPERPPVPAPEPLALGHEPDFIVNPQGQTVVNKGDQTLGQPAPAGGPGMDQQAPNVPAPQQIAPKQLGLEPDLITDAQGRTIVNKGDRTLGEPFGGPGLDQPAPARYPDAQPGSLADVANTLDASAPNAAVSRGTLPNEAPAQPGTLANAAQAIRAPEPPTPAAQALPKAETTPDAQPTDSVAPAQEAAKPSEPVPGQLQTPDEAHEQDFQSRLGRVTGAGDLDADTLQSLRNELHQPLPRDRTTGFYQSNQLDPAAERAQQWTSETGKPATYVEADLTNLNGLNSHLGTSGADEVYKAATESMHQRLTDLGATVTPVRKGGDEVGFVVGGADSATVHEAMNQARQDVSEMAIERGLGDLAHTKAGREPGFGFHFGLAAIRPDTPLKETFQAADRLVESRKKGEDYEHPQPTGETGTESPAGQPAGAQGPAAAGLGERPTGVPQRNAGDDALANGSADNRAAADSGPGRDAGTGPASAGEPAGTDVGQPRAGDDLNPAAIAPDTQQPASDSAAPVMQNRDRTRAASVEQMTAIANHPDPDRLGFAKTPETGAPMVSVGGNDAKAIPKSNLGKESSVTLADGSKVQVRYAVVDADSALASHNADGSANPEYGQTPKPGEIRALNNGRTAGVQAAYRNGKAADYKQGLIDSTDEHGVSPAAIRGMKRPMLVRVYDEAHNQGEIGKLSNSGGGLNLSAAETAANDARALGSLDDFNPGENGEMVTAQNMPFVRRFMQSVPENERGTLMGADGQPTKQLNDRLRAAVFHKAYDSPELTAALAEDANPDVRNVLNALTSAAPDFARVEKKGVMGDVSGQIAKAVGVLKDARERGQSMDQVMAHGDLFGRDHTTDTFAKFMGDSARSSKRMGEAFKAMAKFIVEHQTRAKNGDMFGTADARITDAISAANDHLKAHYGDDAATLQTPSGSLFTAGGSPRAEARGTDAQSAADRSGGGQPAAVERAVAQGASAKETLDLASVREGETTYGNSSPLPDRTERGVAEPRKGAANRAGAAASVPDGQLDLFTAAGTDRAAVRQGAARLQQNTRLVTTGVFRSGIKKITGWQDAAHIIAPLRKSPQEQMLAVVADADGKPLAVIRHSIGTVDSAPVIPGTLFGAVAQVPGAKQVWFAHNHPSGGVTQSSADRTITAKLHTLMAGSGIEPRGMIVVGPGSKTATLFHPDLSGAGDTAHPITAAARTGDVPIAERQLRRIPTGAREALTGPGGLAKLVRDNGSETGVILLDNGNRAVGFLPMTDVEMGRLRTENPETGAAHVMRVATDANAAAAIPVTHDEAAGRNINALFNEGSAIRPLDIALMDKEGGVKSVTSSGNRTVGREFFSHPDERDSTPASTTGQAHVDAIQQAAREEQKTWGPNAPKLRILSSAEDLPASAKQDARYSQARGFYDPKTETAYIVAPNVKDVREGMVTVAHEVIGHHGIEQILDAHAKGGWDRMVQDIAALRASGKVSTAMRDVLDSVDRRYADASDRQKAKETLAVMAERGLRNGLMDRATAAVRAFVRTLFPNLKLNEADLRRLLQKSDAFVHTDKAAEGSVAPVRAMSFDMKDAQTAGLSDREQANPDRLAGAAKAWKDKGTQSPFFQRFFSGSKVVDAKGEPAHVYHGTGEDFSVFDSAHAGTATEHSTSPLGHFFTENRTLAERYAAKAADGRPADERVVDAYMAVKKPYEMSLDEAHAIDDPAQARALRAKLEAQGYDGIHIAEAKSWVAFDSAQVKSVENRGTFNAKDRDINFSVGATAGDLPRDRREKTSAPSASFLDKVTGVLKPDKAKLAARAIKAVAIQQRDLARGVDRAAWALRDRNVGTADAGIDSFRTSFDKLPLEVRTNPLKNYAGVIAYQQGREIADPVERSFIETMASMLAKQAEAILAHGADKLSLLYQYFPQLWKDPGRAEKMYADMQAKRPLAGGKGFTKRRVFDDYEEGIKAGMEPAFENKADAFMARYQAGERYLAALNIKAGIDQLGLLRAIGPEDRVPAGFARINDNTFAGKVVPELVAKDLNNYLAPGLSQFTAWRNFRWLQNILLSARLGFSAFHAGFTTMDSTVMHLDLGMRSALTGDFAGALRHLAQVPLTPWHAIQGLAGKGAGSSLLRQFYGQEAVKDANTAALLHALTEGGARGRMNPTDYNNSMDGLRRAIRTQDMKGTALHALPGLIEGAMRPIAQHLVPAQKMTARVELMKHELDGVAKTFQKAGRTDVKTGDYAGIVKAMNPDALRQIAGRVVNQVDDRLGQMAYDNLFWNRTVKDIAQASIQSVGWNVGTGNVIFGGLKDAKRLFNPESLVAPLDREGKITDAQMSRVTGRLSYLVSLNLGIGLLGAATQYMMTGQGPSELKDYFFPKTGRNNPDGSAERMSFPSYVKDEFSFAAHPVTTVEHKLHPAFSMIAELLNNKDFYGTQIVNPDDPWTKMAGQVAGYLGRSVEPYALQNRAHIQQAGGSALRQALPFIGITPAAGDISKSAFQTFVSDKAHDRAPSGAKTPEESDRLQKVYAAEDALRAGQSADYTGLTPADIAQARRGARKDPYVTKFQRLSLEDKLRAYDQATADERQRYQLAQHITNAAHSIDRLPEEERQSVRQHLQQVRSGGA